MVENAHGDLLMLAYFLAKAFYELFFAGKWIQDWDVHYVQINEPTRKLKSLHHHFIRATEAYHNILSL